jgi:hypothetical protein
MARIRQILFALLMALAVVTGQYAVAAHDLAHASHKEGVPGKNTCDKCFACAELSSAVGASIPTVVLPETTPQFVRSHCDAAICAIPCVAYNPRAPPAFF